MENWISVNDKLPELNQSIYYYTEDNCHGLAYFAGCEDFFNLFDTEELILDITHWIPLPDAPNKEQDNAKN